ncbi:MAG: hypothetical protein P8Z34_01225 [Anaerolineales bacterium]
MTPGFKEQVTQLRDQVINESLRFLHLSQDTVSGKIIGGMLASPAMRLAELVQSFDQLVAGSGLHEASRRMLDRFVRYFEVELFANLKSMRDHFILVSRNTFERLAVVREVIRHLQEGGAVLIFPRGLIEPDPQVLTGATESLSRWSPSLEVMLRRVPQAHLSVTIIRGVLSSWSIKNPLTRLRRSIHDKQVIAEISQAVQHLFLPRTLAIAPRLNYAPPMTFNDIVERYHGSNPMDVIRQTAAQLIDN